VTIKHHKFNYLCAVRKLLPTQVYVVPSVLVTKCIPEVNFLVTVASEDFAFNDLALGIVVLDDAAGGVALTKRTIARLLHCAI
jgi:hypothetical protein